MSEAYIKIESEVLEAMVSEAVDNFLTEQKEHKVREEEALILKREEKIKEYESQAWFKKILDVHPDKLGIFMGASYYFLPYNEHIGICERLRRCCSESKEVTISSEALDVVLSGIKLGEE